MEEPEQEACENCAGTGWIVVEEGNVARAKRCNCSRVADGDKLLASAKIPTRYQACDFDNYLPQSFLQGKTKSLLENYAVDYPLLDDEIFREKSLLLTGGSGRGKTHLAVSVFKALLKKGVPCRFVDFHELLAEIRSSYDELAQTSEYEILRPLLNVEVLLLDDLGSQRMSGWVQDTVFYIINIRYNQKKPLIVTSNLSMEPSKGSPLESLQDRLGYRVVSRLYEMCTCVELDGPDYRKEVRKAGGDFLRSRVEGNREQP
jgi:DNA replication protein DnaC